MNFSMKQARFWLILSLYVLTQFSASLYLPTLPNLVAVFNTTRAAIAFSLSAYFIGYGAGQLFWGPLSDTIGRKKPILFALTAYTIIAVCITFSATAFVLMLLIGSLGFFAAAFPSIGYALLKDMYGSHLKRIIATIGVAMALAPTLAPILGTVLLKFIGWKSIFLSLALLAGSIGLCFAFTVPETYQPKSIAQPHHKLKHAFLRLMGCRQFLGFSLSLGIIFGGLFALLGGAPFIFITDLGYGHNAYSIIVFAITAFYLVGTILNNIYIKHQTPYAMVKKGLPLTSLGAVLLLFFTFYHAHSLWILMPTLMLFMTGIGIVVPAAKAGAMEQSEQHPGTAAALMKFIQISLTVTVTGISAHLQKLPGEHIFEISAWLSFTAVTTWLIFLLFVTSPIEKKDKPHGKSTHHS